MIAPHELKNKAFNRAVRGYASSEVDDYIDFLIDKYTEVYRKNSELEKELHTTKLKYSELHHDEDTIRSVIVKAQKLGENIVAQARVEADKIIESASDACREKIAEADARVRESIAEADRIRHLSDEFRKNLYNEYLQHIQTLKALDLTSETPTDPEFPARTQRRVEEQSEIAREKLSTIRSDENETIIV